MHSPPMHNTHQCTTPTHARNAQHPHTRTRTCLTCSPVCMFACTDAAACVCVCVHAFACHLQAVDGHHPTQRERCTHARMHARSSHTRERARTCLTCSPVCTLLACTDAAACVCVCVLACACHLQAVDTTRLKERGARTHACMHAVQTHARARAHLLNVLTCLHVCMH